MCVKTFGKPHEQICTAVFKSLQTLIMGMKAMEILGSLMIFLKSFFSGQDDCTVIFNDFKKLDAQV